MSSEDAPSAKQESAPPPERERGRFGLGPGLRRAWIGYQRRLDEHLAEAGFDDRKLPDGRVMRICARSPETTASQIGRELGISRQAAGKIVNDLRDRGYLDVQASRTNGRENSVTATPRALAYLAAQRAASRRIERELRTQVGSEAFDGLRQLLEVLAGDDPPRMSVYLRGKRQIEIPES